MKRKIFFPMFIVVAGVLVAAVLILNKREAPSVPSEFQPPLVRVMAVELRGMQLKVRSQGTVAPQSQIELMAEVSGRVAWVSPALADGGFFEAEDLLLKLEPRDYELAVIRARAEVTTMEVRLEREEAEAETARQEWEELGEGPASGLALRGPQVAEARAMLAAAQAGLEQASRDLERTMIQAPFAGRVSRKHVDAGQFVNRGSPLARIFAVENAEIRLPLSLDDLAFLDLPMGSGDQAENGRPIVEFRGMIAGKEEVWLGEVVRAESEIDPRTRMLHAVARVKNADGGGKRPGMPVGLFVQAEIFGKQVNDVMVVPRQAMQGRDQVLVVNPEDRLEFRRVSVVRFEREHAVIRSGLGLGDRVIISPMDAPVAGMRVRTVDERQGGENRLITGAKL
jgi:membrane fusion protein, multidrug efflux system